MYKNRSVVVTGLGAITPIGNTIDEFWKSLIEGKSGVRRLSCFDPTYFSSKVAAEVRDFDPSQFVSTKDMKRMDRFVVFAVAAAKNALIDSRVDLEKEDRNRIGVLVGSGIGGLHTIESEHGQYLRLGPVKGRAGCLRSSFRCLLSTWLPARYQYSSGLKALIQRLRRRVRQATML